MIKPINKDILKIRTDRPNIIEWLIPGLVFFLFLVGYFYIDCKSLTGWSCIFLDCIFDGRLWRIYEVINKNPLGTYHEYMGVNFIILIPWSIWNIPVWIMERFFDVDVLNHTLTMLWSKLFLYALAVIMIIKSNSLMKLLNIDINKRQWTTYLIGTGAALFSGVALAGQNDILLLVFGVFAVYSLIQGNEVLFILFMALSMTTKPFFLFSYIAVILLIEKNIFRAILKIIIPMIPVFFFAFIYNNAPMYKESVIGGSLARLIEGTIKSSIPVGNGYMAPLFIMVILIIYIIAFCQENNDRKNEYIIYMMIAPMLIYYSFCDFEFYRLIYTLPFLFILVGINNNSRIGVLISSIICILGLLLGFLNPHTGGHLSGDPFMTDIMQINPKLLFGAERVGTYGSIGEFFLNKVPFILYLREIMAGMFTALNLTFLVIFEPTMKVKFDIIGKRAAERWIYWLQPLLLVCISLIFVICYIS